MPPNHFAKCTNCQNENVYDEAELLASKPGAKVYRLATPLPPDENHNFVVTCKHCKQNFKIRIKITMWGG